jgi:hypothetical protein
VDTLRLIKINNNQLYVELSSTSINFSKKITVNYQLESIKSLSRIITHDILNSYVKSGPSIAGLKKLNESAFQLFNFFEFFNFEKYFKQIKVNNKNHYLHLIVDSDLNSIPFEILHDGQNFLSDYLILSRESTNSNISDNKFKVELKNKFAIVVNPSESDDINDDVINEANIISNIVDSKFNLRGPFKHRNVDKIELIRLLGSCSLLHFSGHYKNNGWKLFNDIFESKDILKCSRASDFIFSNSCGDNSNKFNIFINTFLNKGTKTIICSLGKLPSNKARIFSETFYKYFIEYGHDAGESLFLTKKKMIKKYGYQDLFWCYYQLHGSSLLSINKIYELTSKASKNNFAKKSIIFCFSLLVLIFIYNFIFNSKNHQTQLKINIKSNINTKVQTKTIKTDSIQILSNNISYPILLKCDSIKNNQPYFSLIDNDDQKQTHQLIIDKDLNNNIIVEYPYEFNNNLLNVYLSNKNLFNRLEIIFDDEIEYSVYIQYEKRDLKNIYTLYIVDIINDNRYKINLNKLFQMISPIHKDYLKAYYDELSILFPRNSKFELIKKDFTFKNRLVLDIKKGSK